MALSKSNGNGNIKSMADFEGKEIEFPVTYQMKAVMIQIRVQMTYIQ